MKSFVAAPTALAALALLSACGGGGGVSSTPAPPTGGGGSGQTPTPSPSSTPNTSLLNLTSSETFTSDSGQASATFTANGSSAVTSSKGSLTVAYDASTNSYTLTSGARTQSFRPADQTAATPEFMVYQRTNGSTTDSLTLSRPGTAGAFKYQYVGAGVWERAIDHTTSVDGLVDPFTYGVETPDAALPRTGDAGFEVDLIGELVSKSEFEPNAMIGSGSLLVDFATGKIDTNGTFQLIRPSTGASGYGGAWTGTANLSSAANLFSGSFKVLSFGETNGGFDGRFYGPAAQEVGATFHTAGSTGEVATGALVGRRSSNVVTGTPLDQISVNTAFVTTSELTAYETDAAGNLLLQNDAPRFVSYTGSTAWVDYTADTNSYSVRYQKIDPSGSSVAEYETVSVNPADLLTTQPDARFNTYRVTLADGAIADVRFYKPGGSNTELALSYASFANVKAQDPVDPTAVVATRSSYVPFGYRTPVNQIPVAGTASYSGVLYGDGVKYAGVGGPSVSQYSLSGTANFTLDFLASNGTLRLVPVGTDIETGATISFGNFDFMLLRFGNDIRGSVQTGAESSDFQGALYGPRGEEIAGAFSLRFTDPNDQSVVKLGGVAVGKK